MQTSRIVHSLVISASLVLAACAQAPAAPTTLLAAVQQRGYMLISNDPNYAPQSVLKKDGKRNATSKCPSDALTTGEMEGFDVDVAAGVSKAIGVEPCFVTPDWSVITAGNWADKWDVSIGSMTITTERQKALNFTSAYTSRPPRSPSPRTRGSRSYPIWPASRCVSARPPPMRTGSPANWAFPPRISRRSPRRT